jgi:hypothetical protein
MAPLHAASESCRSCIMRAHWRFGISVAAEAHGAKYTRGFTRRLLGNINWDRSGHLALYLFYVKCGTHRAMNLKPCQDSGDESLSVIVLCTPYWERKFQQGRRLRDFVLL